MNLCLNLKMQIIFTKTKQLLDVTPLKSANQRRNTFIIIKRAIKQGPLMSLYMVVLFSLSTGSGANLWTIPY